MAALKVIEVLSSSTTSWENTTQKAVSKASKSVKHTRSVYAQNQSANVENREIFGFRAKLTFEIE